MLSDAEGQTFRIGHAERVARTLGARQTLVLAALSAGLYVLGFAGVGYWPLSFVALVPVFFAIEYGTRSHKQLWATGWLFGVLTNLGGFYWLVPAMRHFWALSLGTSLLLLFALCIWQGGLLALFVWLCGRVRTTSLPLVAVAALPALELLYPLVFPSYFGNAMHDQRSLIQIADLGGPLLVSALLVLINGGAYELLRGGWRRQMPHLAVLTAAVLMLVLTLGYGAFRTTQIERTMRAAPKLTVGLVQANVEVGSRERKTSLALRSHLALSKSLEGKVDLLIWPESSVQSAVSIDARFVGREIRGGLRTPRLFGGIGRRTTVEGTRFFNSAFLIDPRGRLLSSHDKTLLVPFAEYAPFRQSTFASEEVPERGRFSRGSAPRLLNLGEASIAALICYEDLFPALVRRMVRTEAPNLLVNLTNDAWFGDSQGPFVHFALARFRAVEQRRYLVRATNSGLTAVIDPTGRVTAEAPTGMEALLRTEVALLNDVSPYARLGDWPGWLGLLCVALGFARGLPWFVRGGAQR